MNSVYADTSAVNDQHNSSRPAGPWTRYWVRSLDLTLCTYGCGAAAWFVIKPAGLAGSLAEHPFIILLGILALTPAALLLDALIYAVFGNTLCRAVMGTQVLTRDGEKLTSQQYFHRNLAMWGPGYGFGLPFATFLTFVLSFIRLRDTGYTNWDAKAGYVVRVRGRLVSNYVLTFGVWFFVQSALSVAVVVCTALLPSPSRQDTARVAMTPAVVPVSAPESREVRWLNPHSKMEATLPEGWGGGLYNADKQTWSWTKGPRGPWVGIHFWPLDGKRAAPLGEYAESMRRTGTGFWALVGPGKVEWEGRAVWQGEETVTGPKGFPLEDEPVFMMTRIFEGDGGVWVMAYAGPAFVANREEGIAVGRALQAATGHG
ncbi:RDD family protein [Paraburkholderia sp. RL18-085-BIA-A]|uniref:RDD family protein n=1 Tax=Paraburkholderia sp. RL18-085-BIA-A TaxID=3031633 RepID=UPI0038B75DA9